MEIQVKNISHKFIDSLSDGVFAVAMTLLGFNVVSLVPELTKSTNLNAALAHEWPTFLAYILGFVVLLSMWHSYHTRSQYVEGTNAWIVWRHGLGLMWVALLPFGVALLASNLNTSNRKWGVFYFGVCLFGSTWTGLLQAAFVKFKVPVNFVEELPISPETMRKVMLIFDGITSVLGLILVGISLLNPWVALVGYSLYIFTNTNPVKFLNRLMPRLVARL